MWFCEQVRHVPTRIDEGDTARVLDVWELRNPVKHASDGNNPVEKESQKFLRIGGDPAKCYLRVSEEVK